MTDSPGESAFTCALPVNTSSLVRLGHGSGGKMTERLLAELFLPILGNEVINKLDDAAVVPIHGGEIAVTTDAYVVSPIFFPGGDIGSLAVHGTVNDLAMRGARPLYMSASFILEEGLPMETLARVAESMRRACDESGITLVAADTKVVNRGAADRVFITTTGIGVIESSPSPGADRVRRGDVVIVSGDIGRHGMAIMCSREGIEMETEILSDSCALYELVKCIFHHNAAVHCLRDITRGGLSSVLNEIAVASKVGIEIEETLVPIHSQVHAGAELLGLDPFYLACEGRLVAFAPEDDAAGILERMNRQSAGSGACIIGTVVDEHVGRVILRSRIGGKRILDKLSGEQLPRIC